MPTGSPAPSSEVSFVDVPSSLPSSLPPTSTLPPAVGLSEAETDVFVDSADQEWKRGSLVYVGWPQLAERQERICVLLLRKSAGAVWGMFELATPSNVAPLPDRRLMWILIFASRNKKPLVHLFSYVVRTLIVLCRRMVDRRLLCALGLYCGRGLQTLFALANSPE